MICVIINVRKDNNNHISVKTEGCSTDSNSTSASTPLIFGSATGRPLYLPSPLTWKEPLPILQMMNDGTEKFLDEMLVKREDFVEVLATLEFEVGAFGTDEARLHTNLRFDRIVRLATEGILL